MTGIVSSPFFDVSLGYDMAWTPKRLPRRPGQFTLLDHGFDHMPDTDEVALLALELDERLGRLETMVGGDLHK